MVRFVSTFRLKDGFDPEETYRLWEEVHVPGVIAAKADGYSIKKYVISRLVSAPDGHPEYFGMAEIWFDNMEDAKKCMKHLADTMRDAFGDRITDARRVFAFDDKEINLNIG